jgi:Sugar (and other) transporter
MLEMRVEAALIAHQNAAPGTKRGSIWGQWALLFTEQYKTQTWIGVSVMFFQQWTGINAVLYYAPFMMRSMGVRGDTVMLISSGFVSIMQFLSVIPAIIYIDRLGGALSALKCPWVPHILFQVVALFSWVSLIIQMLTIVSGS